MTARPGMSAWGTWKRLPLRMKVGSVGSSAAGVDGAGHAPGRHEPVGERQGRQPALPTRLLVDAAGFVWRDFGEDWVSGCPFNPDNEPLPEPITEYLPRADVQASPSPEEQAGEHQTQETWKDCPGKTPPCDEFCVCGDAAEEPSS